MKALYAAGRTRPPMGSAPRSSSDTAPVCRGRRSAGSGAHHRPKDTEFPRKPRLCDDASTEAVTPPVHRLASNSAPAPSRNVSRETFVRTYLATNLPAIPSLGLFFMQRNGLAVAKNFEFGKTHAIQVRTGRRSVKATFSVQVLCGKLPFNVSAAHGVTSEFDIFSPCGTPLNARDERGDATRA